MVYYFTSNVVDPTAKVYVGKDKVENEELIRYGWEEDVWVCRLLCPVVAVFEFISPDNLSSAHIYLRLAEGQSWDNIPQALIEDCAQLTKANSIEGNKRDNVTIIYTPWSNLKKDGSMAVGQVGFHDSKKTKRVRVPTRTNAIINRLQKTRTEIPPPASTSHLREAKEENLAAKRKVANEELRKKNKEDARLATERRDEKAKQEAEWEALYGEGRVGEEGTTNNDGGFDEDDFM